ncbi:hypothetical protein QQ054_15025 [Oscillatoria amoena NRMC-F 0135]|nr:hypothetical protein [Oscillatoria amoena NRMC-F 0135]
MKTYVQGGYVTITVGQFANVCEARKSGRISFLGLRVWLACHEQRAKRCMAKGQVLFTVGELARLIRRASERAVTRALSELQANQLLDWSEAAIQFPSGLQPEAEDLANSLGTKSERPVPVPRYILRGLFRHTRPSEVMAAIGHLIRCLFKAGAEIRAYGLVKASWVASVFGVGERSVHAARKWLMRVGFLSQEVVHQLVMNRWGAKFVVRLTQRLTPRAEKPRRSGRSQSVYGTPVVGATARADGAGTESAPPSLNRSLKVLHNQINNKPAFAASGVCTADLPEPTLRSIRPEDLRQMPRLEKLYRQAVQAAWVEPCEAGLRNFVCAALRATRAGGRVGAIFVGIVRNRLWHHVTQEQEDRAMKVLRGYRDRNPGGFGGGREAEVAQGVGREAVAQLVATVLNSAERKRGGGEEANWSGLVSFSSPIHELHWHGSKVSASVSL